MGRDKSIRGRAYSPARFVLLLFLLLLAGMLPVAWLWFSTPPRHRINEASFEKIEPGMTEADVIVILGVPYGQYYSGESDVDLPFGPINSSGQITTDRLRDDLLCKKFTYDDGRVFFERKGWVGEHMSIWVLFDENGIVVGKLQYLVEAVHPGVVASILKWLGR